MRAQGTSLLREQKISPSIHSFSNPTMKPTKLRVTLCLFSDRGYDVHYTRPKKRACTLRLRAAPDIIMIGKMRDLETAKIAVEASLTGHPVLCTLHTNSAAETVTRLTGMCIGAMNVADSLYKPAGCDHCNNCGYRGRAGIHELLVASPAIKKLIHAQSTAETIKEKALSEGTRTLAEVKSVCIE